MKQLQRIEKRIPLLAILLISVCATIAGISLTVLNQEVVSSAEIASTQQAQVEWMKKEHFRIMEHDAEVLQQAYEKWEQALDVNIDYHRTTNKTVLVNETTHEKITEKLNTYEMYMRNIYIYMINGSLKMGRNATISRQGDFVFTITQDDWIRSSVEGRPLMYTETFWSMLGRPHSVQVFYFFEQYNVSESFSEQEMVKLSDLWFDHFEWYNQEFLNNSGMWVYEPYWKNKMSIFPQYNYYYFNYLLTYIIDNADDEATAYSKRAEECKNNFDFVTVFVSITTVGTILASALSNRMDNKKIHQNYTKIRYLLKDESEMTLDPDRGNLMILIIVASISVSVALLILLLVFEILF